MLNDKMPNVVKGIIAKCLMTKCPCDKSNNSKMLNDKMPIVINK
jgi:hypothetical protein